MLFELTLAIVLGLAAIVGVICALGGVFNDINAEIDAIDAEVIEDVTCPCVHADVEEVLELGCCDGAACHVMTVESYCMTCGLWHDDRECPRCDKGR